MIGDRIRSFRKYFGITQRELADSIHHSLYTVQAWEQGKGHITIDSVISICRQYDISADYLLELKEDEVKIIDKQKEALSAENRKMLQKFTAFLIEDQKHKS